MLVLFELYFIGSQVPFSFMLADILALQCWNSGFQTIGRAFALLVLAYSNVMELSVATGILSGNKAVLEVFLSKMSLRNIINYLGRLLTNLWLEGTLLELSPFLLSLLITYLCFFTKLLLLN